MPDPRISVIIPAYSAAPYIEQTLEAVGAQTVSDYEVIVVNDGSPDTAELERAIFPHRYFMNYVVQSNRRSVAWLTARLEIERGKRHFPDGDVPATIAAVTRAQRLYPRLKWRAILVALRIAPWWLRRLHVVRRGLAPAPGRFMRPACASSLRS